MATTEFMNPGWVVGYSRNENGDNETFEGPFWNDGPISHNDWENYDGFPSLEAAEEFAARMNTRAAQNRIDDK